MSKNTNLSFLTDYITADITNGRIGINNASPAYAFDVTGIARTSTSTYLATASGNVGIGTTSPTRLLDVSAAGTAYIRASDTTNSVNVDMLAASSGGWIGTQSSHAFILQTANTERMRITSAGNVGIGTSSPVATLSMPASTSNSQISTGSIEVQSYAVNNAWIGDNIYFNGAGFVTRAAGYAKQIYFGAGSLSFNVASTSYAAGAATTLITALSILNSGAATFSSSVASTWHSVNGAIPSSAASTGYLDYSGGGTRLFSVGTSGSTKGTFTFIAKGADDSSITPLSITSGGRILCSGDVWGTERFGVVLDSSLASSTGITAYMNNTSYTGSLIRVQAETVGNTSWYGYELRAQGVIKYGIYGNGSVTAPSDERRKKNIETTRDGYLKDLCNLRVVKYNWKDDEEGKDRELGFIAQEVEKIFPKLVETGHDGLNNENEVKLLKQVVLIPILVKAIQELKAEIETLKNK